MLSPAQNMARLTNAREIGLAPAMFDPASASIGLVLWYQRGLIDTTTSRSLFIERAVTPGSDLGLLMSLDVIGVSPYTFVPLRVRAMTASGSTTTATSNVSLPDDRLALILAWRTPTELGISVDGETPVTVPFTPPSPAIVSTYGALGTRVDSVGPFSANPSRFVPGDYFSAGYYAGIGSGRPFSDADRAALLAAGPVAYEDIPTLSSGTLTGYYDIDSLVNVDRVGGQKTLRFRVSPTWVRPPVTRSSGAYAWDLGHVRSFGEGPTAFSFEAAAAPVFMEPPRRILCDETTKGSRPQLIMSGNSAWGIGVQSWGQPPAPGESAVDTTIYSEPGTDGTWDWLLVGGRYSSLRYRDSVGATVFQNTATEGRYRERTILAVAKFELTNSSFSDLRTRLDLTLSPGHDMADGQVIRIDDAGWPGDHVVTFVSDDDTVVSLTRDGHGHPLPAVGSIVFGTQDEIGTGKTGSLDSRSVNLARAIGLHVERLADGTINHYSRGRLIGTGTVPTSLVGSAAGAVAWLGGAPGDGPAASHELLGLLGGASLSAAKKAELRENLNVLVEGRDGFRDDVVFLKATDAAAIDRVGVIDHPVLWHLTNPDGTDHRPQPHADTGQSRGRVTTPWAARQVGSHDLSVDTTYPTSLAIWPRTVNRDGSLNPGRTGAPTVLPIPIRRRARPAYQRDIHVSLSHVNASDSFDNGGTDPNRPLLTAAAAIARAGPFDDICLTPGDFHDLIADMRPGGVSADRAAGRLRIHTLGAGVPAKFRRFVFAAGVRNVAERFDLLNAEADKQVLNFSGSNFSASAVRNVTVTNTADNGTHVYYSANPNLSGTWGSLVDIRVRNQPTSAPNTGPYGYFFDGGTNYFSMVGHDIQMTAHGGGGHPFRWAGGVFSEISHMPSLPAGFTEGPNREMSFRGNARHIYVSDIGIQGGRKFVFHFSPARIDSRSNFAFHRVLNLFAVEFAYANSAIVQHSRYRSGSIANPNSGGHTEHVVARVRAMGLQMYPPTVNVPYSAATQARFVPDSGPWRYQVTADSQDFGPAICPNVGSINVVGNKAYIRSEGFPLGGLAWQKLQTHRRPAGSSSDGVVIVGEGSGCVADTPGPGQWEYRHSSGGGAAFGAWSAAVSVPDESTS